MSLTLDGILGRVFKVARSGELQLLKIRVGGMTFTMTPRHLVVAERGMITEIQYRLTSRFTEPQDVGLKNIREVTNGFQKTISDYLNARPMNSRADVSVLVRETLEKETDCYVVRQQQRNLFDRMSIDAYLEKHRITH